MRKTRLLARRGFSRAAGFFAGNALRLFPARGASCGYRARDLGADLRAGGNVALLAFPQGMAYAAIAELPIQHGIISGAVAALVAPAFSGSRHTILGPTNATAFMVFSSLAIFSDPERLRLLPLLCLLTGILLVAGALLRVADLIQYISRSVVVGYVTGAAVLIAANQARHLLGIELPPDASGLGGPRTFVTIMQSTLAAAGSASGQAAALGAATFVLWWLLARKARGLPAFATALVVMSAAYALLRAQAGWAVDTFAPFQLQDLAPGLPSRGAQGLFHDISRVAGVAFSVAFLASLETSVMSKSLASRSGDRPDPNQDMLGLGMANAAVSLAGGMPASGSLTRSALNYSSGAASRMSSVISGLLCGAGLLALGPWMHLVPKPVLAALVMCIAVSVVNRRHLRMALRATPSDAAVLLTTLAAALLLPLNLAIFLGVAVSVMLYLRKASRPYLTEYEFSERGELREAGEKRARPIPAISIVHVEGELFFGAAELFRTQILKICLDPDLRVIILRLKNARHLDATSVMALDELVRAMRSSGRELIISGASKEVYRVLRNSGMVEVIGRKNLFLNSPRNPNLSTRNALKRAQEVLGAEKADVRIFYDPTKG